MRFPPTPARSGGDAARLLRSILASCPSGVRSDPASAEYIAGKIPNRIPVVSERATVKARTGRIRIQSRSSPVDSSAQLPTTRAIRATRARCRTHRPSPQEECSPVKSWRKTRIRPAPSDIRTAVSFKRSEAVARRRLATLVHAMSRTKPTAPSSTSHVGRMSRTIH